MNWLKRKAEGEVTKEKLDSIDWKELEVELANIVGVDIKLKVDLNDRGNIVVESQDLVKDAGVMAPGLKKLKLANFGGGLVGGEDDEQLSLPISYDFEIISGGTNGIGLLNAWYIFKDKKWTIKKKGE